MAVRYLFPELTLDLLLLLSLLSLTEVLPIRDTFPGDSSVVAELSQPFRVVVGNARLSPVLRYELGLGAAW